MTGSGPLLGEDRPDPACDECGGLIDYDVAHIQHEPRCLEPDRDYLCEWLCDCPEVCADCCVDPACPLARQIPGNLTIDEAT